jgi:hypothetical protein
MVENDQSYKFFLHLKTPNNSKEIFLPNTYRYIFAVFPSRSGIAISGAVIGYVTGIYLK